MEKQRFISLCFNILLFYGCRGQNYPHVGNKDPDTVLVEQAPGNGYEKFPEKYSIWFYHDGEPQYFDLTFDDMITESLDPSLFKLSPYLPDDLMNDDNDKDFAFYHNNEDVKSDTRAHFVLHRPDPAAPGHVYGQVNLNGYRYTVEATRMGNKHMFKQGKSLAEHRAKRDLPVEGTDNVIELVVWIAPDLFNYQMDRLGLSKDPTIEWFEIFREAIVRDIDLTFRQITGVNIRLYYAGGGQSTWTGKPWFSNSYNDPYLAAGTCLSDLQKYMGNLIGNSLLPDFDHAVALTRADLAFNTDGNGNARQDSSCTMIASVDFQAPKRPSLKIKHTTEATGEMCTGDSGSSVGIAEVNSGFYRKVVTQAILLGFDGISLAGGSDNYEIMARSNPSFPVPSSNRNDLWIISSATDTDLVTAISSLGSNCLQVQEAGFDFQAFMRGSNTIGELYTKDTQCAIIYGSSSVACSGHTDSNTLCWENALCEVNGTCDQQIIFGDKTTCDAVNLLGCSLTVCEYDLDTTTTSTTSTTSTTATTTTTTSSTTSTTTSTTSTTSTTTSTTSTSSTTSTTSATTMDLTSTVTKETDPSSMIPSSTPSPDCCCERRPLGKVNVEIEYIPCPGGVPDIRYLHP